MAAHEKPEALVGDLREMFRKGGPVFGIVKEKNKYSAETWSCLFRLSNTYSMYVNREC